MALAASPTYKLTPSSEKGVLASNYVSNFDYLDQFLPEVDKKEFNRYGRRTISGFLSKLSAELPYASSTVKWSEEGRLHTLYNNVALDAAKTFTPNLPAGATSHVFRVNETVIVSKGAVVQKGIITAITATTFDAEPYDAATWDATFLSGSGLAIYVYGSEFAKGSNGMSGSLEAQTDIFENKGVIIKDLYEISGSDMAQIGWIEVTDNSSGEMGYLWYLKSKSDTVERFADRLEMAVVEGELAAAGSGAATAGFKGTEGFFSTVSTRGNVHDGLIDTLAEFDSIVDRLNKQGAIEENMMYVSTPQDRAVDDFLATQNSYFSGGASWGAFENGEKMALDLGFQGFRRNGYSFYKTPWKYLNDASTRGGVDVAGTVHGVICPAGSKTVYDEVLGQNIKQPFLSIRYRKSQTEDRKYKTWITGSAGGATNTDLDAMQVQFLSERMLCTVGANNFVIAKG